MSAFQRTALKVAAMGFVALLIGCSHSDHDGHHMDDQPAATTAGYVRAMPPGSTTTAAYLTLENNSDTDFVVANVTSDIAQRSEIHQTLRVGGALQMRSAQNVTIPAQGKLEFRSGGLHIMLMELEETPIAGQRVSLMFTATDARQIMIELPVSSGDTIKTPVNPHQNMHH